MRCEIPDLCIFCLSLLHTFVGEHFHASWICPRDEPMQILLSSLNKDTQWSFTLIQSQHLEFAERLVCSSCSAIRMRAECTSRSRLRDKRFYCYIIIIARMCTFISLPACVFLYAFLQQRFNQRLLVLRGGTVSVHDVAFAVDDKLRLEVPSHASRKLVQTVRPHRIRVRTFHVSFSHDGAVKPFLSRKLFNVRVVRQLLSAKLPARVQQNLQPFAFILFLERNKSLIIAARRASPRRHVRDQHDFSF